MNPETRKLLLRYDAPNTYEFPSDFNYPETLNRASIVANKLADILKTGVKFEGGEYYQDASFSMAINFTDCEKKTEFSRMIPSIRISNFGNLATICWIDLIPGNWIHFINEELVRGGFQLVDENELMERYDGCMQNEKMSQTWFQRYFDWI